MDRSRACSWLAYDDGKRSDEDGESEGGTDATGDGDAALSLDEELQEGDHGPEETQVHDAQQFHGGSLREHNACRSKMVR